MNYTPIGIIVKDLLLFHFLTKESSKIRKIVFKPKRDINVYYEHIRTVTGVVTPV